MKRGRKRWIVRKRKAAKVKRSPVDYSWTVQAHPNPFHTVVYFTVFPAGFALLSLLIHDIRGHLVHQSDEVASGDRISLRQDGRDRNEQVVSAGVYLHAIRQGPVYHLGRP